MKQALELREKGVRSKLVILGKELARLQYEHKELEKELDGIVYLLGLYSSDGIEQLLNSVKDDSFTKDSLNLSDVFEGKIVQILTENGKSMHVDVIKNVLLEHGVPIPGRGTTANIITRMRRANGHFTRVASGTYGLAEWNLEPMTPKRGRRRRKKSVKSNG